MKNTKTITGLSLAALLALTACGDDNGVEETEGQESENQAEENGSEEEAEEGAEGADLDEVEALLEEYVSDGTVEEIVEFGHGETESYVSANLRATHLSNASAAGSIAQEIHNRIIDEIDGAEEAFVTVNYGSAGVEVYEYAEVEQSALLEDFLDAEVQPVIDEEIGEGEVDWRADADQIWATGIESDDADETRQSVAEIAEIVFREIQGQQFEDADPDSVAVFAISTGPEDFTITSDGTLTVESAALNEEAEEEDLGWDYSGEGDGDTDDEDSEEDDDFFED